MDTLLRTFCIRISTYVVVCWFEDKNKYEIFLIKERHRFLYIVLSIVFINKWQTITLKTYYKKSIKIK